MIPAEPAARHRAVAASFTERVHGVADWAASTPVAGWTVGDVVDHLVDWSTGFLAAGGVALPPPTAGIDLATRWLQHTEAIQVLLDGNDADRTFTHPQAGTLPLATAIDNFYTSDVFMHTWDLAQATGQDAALDAAECSRLLEGMEQVEDALRVSGQYGSRVDVPDIAPPQARLMAFIGREPQWSAPTPFLGRTEGAVRR